MESGRNNNNRRVVVLNSFKKVTDNTGPLDILKSVEIISLPDL